MRGKANFAFSTLQEVLESDFFTVRVKIDEKQEKTLNTINFAVANSRFFGGGMKIAPDAKINDGFFDVDQHRRHQNSENFIKRLQTLWRFASCIKRSKINLAKRIEVSAFDESETIHIETDGELPGKLPAVWEIVPNALKVRVPTTK